MYKYQCTQSKWFFTFKFSHIYQVFKRLIKSFTCENIYTLPKTKMQYLNHLKFWKIWKRKHEKGISFMQDSMRNVSATYHKSPSFSKLPASPRHQGVFNLDYNVFSKRYQIVWKQSIHLSAKPQHVLNLADYNAFSVHDFCSVSFYCCHFFFDLR